jgi:hypothetical protein
VSATRTMTVDITTEDEAILILVQLDCALAERVFADASIRALRPRDLIASALREHYAQLDLDREQPPPRESAGPAPETPGRSTPHNESATLATS